MQIDVFHLFLWEPFAFQGTPFAMNRVSLLTLVAAALCIGFFLAATRRMSLVPRALQSVAETGYLFVRNNIAVDVIGPAGARFAPYLATIFFFIFFCNLLEIVPGINFPVTSRMAIPGALAILTWIVFNAVGFGRNGLRYLKDTLFPPGVPWPVYFILTPIEFASVFLIRPFTLAVRLLANMLAGHVLLTVFFLFTQQLIIENFGFGSALGILTLLVACLLILFELLVISIQAYIFTVLTAFYIAEAIHSHGDEATEDTDHLPAERETELATA